MTIKIKKEHLDIMESSSDWLEGYEKILKQNPSLSEDEVSDIVANYLLFSLEKNPSELQDIKKML